MSEILVLQSISKNFGGVKALDSVTFSISEGEIHCLVGENGSGKSTLIKIISGAERADAGQIIVGGRVAHHLQSADSIHSGIQVIYQDLSLFPNLTVAENIAAIQMVEGRKKIFTWRDVTRIAIKAIQRIGLSLDLNEIVGNLSVANQQLVAISRALTKDVKLLIMDEPTTALAKNEIGVLFSIIKDLQRKGISILFVSHKLNEIFQIAERVTILRDGKCVGTYDSHELTNEKLIMLMTGKRLEYSFFIPKESNTEVVLECRNLCKEGTFKDISFNLKKGEILGFAGLLGSGRTELALALFGIEPWTLEQ